MTQDYQGPPVAPVPPVDLLVEWQNALRGEGIPTSLILRRVANWAAAWAWEQAIATLAERERAAADAELEWCYAWLGGARDWLARDLRAAARAARRPKPPALAEKGLAALVACSVPTEAEYDTIRAALLRLQELEQAATTTATTTTTETTND